MFTKKTLTAMAALTALSAAAFAQTPPPAHHGLFGGMFHRHAQPGQPGAVPAHHSLFPFHHSMTPGGQPGMMSGNAGGGAAAPMAGGVIGNKNTHVYHMPGDNNLPSAKNRVYFASPAAAQAAGYHAAGAVHAGAMTRHKTHH